MEAGDTLAQRMATTLTRGQQQLLKCKGYVAVEMRAFRFPVRQSTVLLLISISALCQMVAYNTAQKEEGDGQQFRQRQLHAYSTLVNTMIPMFPGCSPTPKHLGNIANAGFGHWHYAHYYYSQVMYREGGQKWSDYRRQIEKRLVAEATKDRTGVSWQQGYIGPVYTTATNLTILQLDNGMLPIYQR